MSIKYIWNIIKIMIKSLKLNHIYVVDYNFNDFEIPVLIKFPMTSMTRPKIINHRGYLRSLSVFIGTKSHRRDNYCMVLYRMSIPIIVLLNKIL